MGNALFRSSDFAITKVPVINKQFRNETVVLDGKSFSQCEFENVTFEYNGTAAFDLIGSRITGTYILSTQDARIRNVLVFMKEFKFIKEEVRFYDR